MGRTFVIGACLGRGGYGEVYRATMRSPGGLDTTVAIKLLRQDLALEDDAVRRLRDEGRALARLDHPGILRVIDLVTLDGRLGLVTELVDGCDLVGTSRVDPPLGTRALLQVGSQVAGALEEAWNASSPSGPLRLVHRDVKPSNILIGRHGQVRLVDFGIARSDALTREAHTRSDAVIGSLPYIAPERFVERTVGPAVDVFSLGCVIFEGLTGERYYPKEARAAVPTLALDAPAYERHRQDRLQLLHGVASDPLRDTVASMLSYDPAHRPAAREVAATLDQQADAASGPSLRSWARVVTFPPPRHGPGPYEGRTLEEGPAPQTRPDPPASAPVAPVVTLRPSLTLAETPPPSPTAVPVAEPKPGAASARPPRAAGRPIAAPLKSMDERAFTEQHVAPLPRSPAAPPEPRPAPRRFRWVRWAVAAAAVALVLSFALVALAVLVGALWWAYG